jgi:hypothetical protein
MILATSETAITIIASSIPVLRVLIRNTMHTHSHQSDITYTTDDSQKSQLERTISGFDLIPPSPAQLNTPRNNNTFSVGLNDRSNNMMKRAASKSTDDSWLSSPSLSQEALRAHQSSLSPDMYNSAGSSVKE